MAEAMELIQVELPDNRQGGFVTPSVRNQFVNQHCSTSSAQQRWKLEVRS